MSTSGYQVTGLTRGHCEVAIRIGLASLLRPTALLAAHDAAAATVH